MADRPTVHELTFPSRQAANQALAHLDGWDYLAAVSEGEGEWVVTAAKPTPWPEVDAQRVELVDGELLTFGVAADAPDPDKLNRMVSLADRLGGRYWGARAPTP